MSPAESTGILPKLKKIGGDPSAIHDAISSSWSADNCIVREPTKGRWGGDALVVGTALPHAGRQYEQQRGKVLRRGKVLACLKPVSITLEETLLDPPCCVKLRLNWRIEPKDDGACVLLDARYSLNGAAALRGREW